MIDLGWDSTVSVVSRDWEGFLMLSVVILSFALLLLALYWLYSRHLRGLDAAHRTHRARYSGSVTTLDLSELLPQVAPHDDFPWGKAFAEPARKAREMRRWELLADIEHRAFWYCRESSTLGFWRIGLDGAAFWQEWRLSAGDLARLRTRYAHSPSTESATAEQSPQSTVQQRAVGF
mgnify:CR=1 FL=1